MFANYLLSFVLLGVLLLGSDNFVAAQRGVAYDIVTAGEGIFS